jgi:UDP-N-acetylglucosamine--N-acetylmuramyl-(pentapeptide) pyrophosphoryl-undecaprenol N-acetylglucosamine transferase
MLSADLVLCRAGAMTIAELMVFGKAAIWCLILMRFYDHQRSNAESLQERGAAAVILDRELTGEVLAERIRGYFTDQARLERMAAAARLGRPDAAARIVDACYSLARHRLAVSVEVKCCEET